MKRKIYIANIHMFQFGNFEQFKSKEEETADKLPQEKKKRKPNWKVSKLISMLVLLFI